MRKDFWMDKWDRGEIGFHNAAVHPMLATHISKLGLAKGARICLPLCGKTLDIHWLMKHGYRVVGVELAETAVQELFEELGLSPTITTKGTVKHYQAQNIDIYVGDVFDVGKADIGVVDAVYDRAALVALPKDMRNKYAQHLLEITAQAPQLLITFDYNQDEMNGPPFSIPTSEIDAHYKSAFQIECLESRDVAGGLKGLAKADEIVWWLHD